MLRKVQVENGILQGIPSADPRVTVYKGVPFAAPPVGGNRWRAPQPCPDWEGVKKAFEFGPISVQDTPALGDDVYCREWHVDSEIPMSEDCLYLNVWTPANKTDEKLPVLVWFFGGGFQWGYTAEMEFDGERLARRGIVVVSVNYRLAALGFLAHPELTAENPDAPCNFGLLDQQAGLHWVKRNIAAFGGDPDNISIAGQSAGGASVQNQMTCEANFGIIKKAIVFSGFIKMETADSILRSPDLESAEKNGEAFFDFLGVKSLKEARELDAIFIRDQYAEFVKDHSRMAPVADKVMYKRYPYELITENKFNDIPIMSGSTSNEFVFQGENIVGKSTEGAFLGAEAAGSKSNKFYYFFDVDIPGWDNPGAFHSVDLWFWFESINKCWRPFVGRHFDVARLMCNYFANFIKTGNPNGKDADGTDMPEWKPFTDAGRNCMVFDGEGAEPE